MLSGLPGCGKSTFAKTLRHKGDWNKLPDNTLYTISRDFLIDVIGEFCRFTYNEVFQLAPRLIDKMFDRSIDEINSHEWSVIWDMTNLNAATRKRHLDK